MDYRKQKKYIQIPKMKLWHLEFVFVVNDQLVSGWVFLEYQRGVGSTKTKRI